MGRKARGRRLRQANRMTGKRILFRCDASLAIGTGHVMRCLSLADGFQAQGCEVGFVSRKFDGMVDIAVLRPQMTFYELPAGHLDMTPVGDDYAGWLGVPQSEDVTQSLDCAKQFAPDLMVVDHYALDDVWCRTMSEAVPNLLCIDDLINRPIEAHWLLNQNAGVTTEDYAALVSASCTLLVGGEFALLRSEFAARREASLARRQDGELRNIVISMGGGDQARLSLLFFQWLCDGGWLEGRRLDIILGANARCHDTDFHIGGALPAQVRLLRNIDDMAEVLSQADLAIGAGGSSSWERCCLGVPSIITCIAQNQRSLADYLHKRGAGLMYDYTSQGAAAFQDLMQICATPHHLQEMSKQAARLVDGGGVARVVETVLRDC